MATNSTPAFSPLSVSAWHSHLYECKRPQFPGLALVGAGHMLAEGEDEREEARLFYVGAMRATQRLVIAA